MIISYNDNEFIVYLNGEPITIKSPNGEEFDYELIKKIWEG